ncbi:tandem-95 repeat protein, partial [Malikia sp.]|uniref:cadherin-like domain-containing protein n=1 Tax=Malikia sp. TaxID=2070706 RepID=UPI00262F1658
MFPSRDLAITAIGLLLLDTVWAGARALPEEAYKPADPERLRSDGELPKELQDAVPADTVAAADPAEPPVPDEPAKDKADVPQEEVAEAPAEGSIADGKIGAEAGAEAGATAGGTSAGAGAAIAAFSPLGLGLLALAPVALLASGDGGGGGSVNHAPTTDGVTLTPLPEDNSRKITQQDLLSNARDVDGNLLKVTDLKVVSGKGQLVDNGDGSWTYTPALNDDSSVSFSYQVSDGQATVPGSATLDLTPVNDAPVFSGGGTGSVNENAKVETVIYQATATDVEGSAIVYSLAGADSALLNIDPKTGAVTLKASADFETKSSYSFKVIATDQDNLSSARDVIVSVTDLNEKPLTVIDGPLNNAKVYYDTNKDGVADESEYLGRTDANGALNVSYQSVAGAKFIIVSDEQTTDTFTGKKFSLTLSANDGAGNPVVSPLSTLVASGAITETELKAMLGLPANLDLGSFNFVEAIKSGTANAATLAAAQKMTAAAISIGNVIEASLNAKQAGVSASDAMTQAFKITATVMKALPAGTPIADITKIATSLSLASALDSNFNAFDLIKTATAGGATLSASAVTAAVNAALPSNLSALIATQSDQLAKTNDQLETLLKNATSLDSLNALLGDIGDLENAAEESGYGIVNSLVGLNLVKDTATVTEQQAEAIKGNLLDNDGELPDGASLYSVNGTLVSDSADGSVVVMGKYGTLIVQKSGDYSYVPGGDNADNVLAGKIGLDDFTYTVKTADGALATQRLSITVKGTSYGDPTDANHAPVGLADSLEAAEDTEVTYTAEDLLGNDTDADGNPLTIKSVTSGTGGTVVLNEDGTVTFTPDAGFNGEASFSYVATDGTLDTEETAVTV